MIETISWRKRIDAYAVKWCMHLKVLFQNCILFSKTIKLREASSNKKQVHQTLYDYGYKLYATASYSMNLLCILHIDDSNWSFCTLGNRFFSNFAHKFVLSRNCHNWGLLRMLPPHRLPAPTPERHPPWHPPWHLPDSKPTVGSGWVGSGSVGCRFVDQSSGRGRSGDNIGRVSRIG